MGWDGVLCNGFYGMEFICQRNLIFYRVYIILPASGAEQYDHENLIIISACELGGAPNTTDTLFVMIQYAVACASST